MNTALRAPGPRGSFFLGNLADFGRDPLVFLTRCVRDYGDFVPLRFFNRRICLLNDPAHLECVLATQSRSFKKTLGYRTPFMRRLFGQGLLTSEGELWLRQRRLAQPAFHRERIAIYAGLIVEFTTRLVAQWTAGETREIHLEMMRLTTEVVVKTLFNAAGPRQIDDMGKSSAVVMNRFATQWSVWRLLANLFPTPDSWRFERVMRRLDDYIDGVIRERRASGQDAGDLLSMLLLARDEAGQGMNDRQLRDELTTLMVAGLDTTALALSWSFYLLSQNRAVEETLSQELKSVLGGRPAQFSDLPQLRYAESVVKEALRLYPPAWLIGRETVQDCEIGGHPIAAGTSLLMSQWVMHRDARRFERPEQFDPARWLGDAARALPKFAFFPFGGGPRICIGNSFAMMEAVLVLATVAQKFRLTAPPGYQVTPWPSITLQPKEGIWLTVKNRARKRGLPVYFPD